MILFLMLNKLIVFRPIFGFSNTICVDASKKWDDQLYAKYTLALEMDQRHLVKSTDLYHDDNGWR